MDYSRKSIFNMKNNSLIITSASISIIIIILTVCSILFELSSVTSKNFSDKLSEMLPQSILIASALISLTICGLGRK